MKKYVAVFVILGLLVSVSAKDQFPTDEVIKFKTGEVEQKIRYSAYKSVEKSESFYQNGKNKVTYSRTELSEDPFKPDVYKVQAWNDQGQVTMEGNCFVSPTEDFDAKARCRSLDGKEMKYDDEGKLVATTNYKRGKLDGEATVISKEKITKTFFKDDVKVKRQEFEPVTNKLLKEENFFPDGSKK